jgi:hypothetical protein
VCFPFFFENLSKKYGKNVFLGGKKKESRFIHRNHGMFRQITKMACYLYLLFETVLQMRGPSPSV